MRPTKNALENPLNLRRAAPGKRLFPGVPGTLVLAAALCLGGAGAVLAAATEISLNGITDGEKLEVNVDEIAKLDSGREILPGGNFDNAGIIKIVSGIMDLARNRSTFATLRNSGQIDLGSAQGGPLAELVLGGEQLLRLIGRQPGGDAKGKLSVSNSPAGPSTARIRVVDGVTLDTAWLTGSETQAEGTIALLLMAKNIIALEVEKGLTLTDDTGGTLLNVNGAIAVSGGVKLDDAITVQRGRLLLYDGELGGKDLKLGITTGSSNLALLDLGDASMPGSGGVVNTNVEVSRSAVNVNSGVWTLGSGKTLKFSNTGTLTIASGGVLNIGDGRLETTSGATLEVTNFGAVKADASSFGAYNPVNQTFSRLEQAFTVKAGGRLEVAGLHSIWTNNSISEEDLATARANLMVLTAPMPGQISRGLLDIGATEIIEILIDGGKVAYGALTDLGNVTNDALGAATVTGVNGNLSGEFKAVELAGNETRLTVTKTGLSLTGAAGAAGDPLIKKADGSPGDLHVVGSTFESGVVTLGDGAVGKVTLAGSDQNGIAGLNIVGEVNSGAIDSGNLSTSSSSVINVAGGKLTAASIGVDGPVNAVNVTAGGELTVAGNVKINDALNAVGAKITFGGETTTLRSISASHSMLTIDGTLEVSGGSGKVFRLTDGTRATVKKLNITEAFTTNFYVGMPYDTVGSSLSVEELTLNGRMLLVDPDWSGRHSHSYAEAEYGTSKIGPEFIADGSFGVGRNAMLAFGIQDLGKWLGDEVDAATGGAGLTENGVTAALGLRKSLVLKDGVSGLVVDGALLSSGSTSQQGSLDWAVHQARLGNYTGNEGTASHVYFAANSLLVVDAKTAVNGSSAILYDSGANHIVTVENGAKLRITGARVGDTYTVLDAGSFGTINYVGDKAWNGDNLSANSPMVKLTRLTDGTDPGKFRADVNSAENAYPGLDDELGNLLEDLYATGAADPDSSGPGERFLSRATDMEYIGNDRNLTVRTIESALRFAELGAVAQMTMAASDAAGGAVTRRTTLANLRGGLKTARLDGAPERPKDGPRKRQRRGPKYRKVSAPERPKDDLRKQGLALWILPLYQSSNVWNMKAGNYNKDWRGGLGGVALGADFTLENALRLGLAFNLGGGHAGGGGDLANTENNFKFWGLGAYVGWSDGAFGLTADVNYTRTFNEVRQDLPRAMQMDDLKSDITARAVSAGLRGEYKISTDALDIVPHVGVRHMNLTTDGHDVTSGSGTVLGGDSLSRNIWTFPIGLSFSRNLETGNGWFFRPGLDLAVIPADGDIETKSSARFTGTGTKVELESRIMDYVSYTGGIGLEFGNQNVSFGLNYNLMFSEHTTGHGVFGTFRYEF